MQPDVTHGSHYSPQSNNLAQIKIIKKGKKKKKNVLAFIQPTNATFRAMFSWLNTNTRYCLVQFSLRKKTDHEHYVLGIIAL